MIFNMTFLFSKMLFAWKRKPFFFNFCNVTNNLKRTFFSCHVMWNKLHSFKYELLRKWFCFTLTYFISLFRFVKQKRMSHYFWHASRVAGTKVWMIMFIICDAPFLYSCDHSCHLKNDKFPRHFQNVKANLTCVKSFGS